MSALTPGCDPDMSTTGAPYGTSADGPRLRSGLVLLAVVAVSVLLATGDPVPALVALPAVVVGAFCAIALVRRGVRLAHRVGPVAADRDAGALHRSRSVPTGTP